ncbi:MAG: 5'-nucleotidase C-terminal domain-containing protein, partial [Anaerovorax sp.]
VRIAIFSLLGKEADSYAPLSRLAFTDPIEKAKEITAAIKANEKVDLILCLSHSGTKKKLKKSEDHQLAKEVKDIDIIISAHSHTLFREVQFEGSTAIVSIGANGRRLGRLDLSLSKGGITVENYHAIPLDHNISSSKEVTALMKKAKKQVQDSYLSQYGYEFDQVLAYNPYRFTPYVTFATEQQEYPLGNIVSDSYIYGVKQAEGEAYEPIDVSIALSGEIRASLNKGDITVADAFKVNSLGIGKDGITGYPLVTGYLTGKDLKAVAEIDASISTLMPDTQLFTSGLSYTFNPNRILLNRVVDVALEPSPGVQEEIQDDKLYRIVTGLYATQMLHMLDEKSKGLLSILPKDRDGNAIKDYEDFIVEDGRGEVKEWLALASYLESFEQINGLPTIPERYKDPQGRKIVHEDKRVLSIVEKPNKVFLGLVAISTALLCGLVSLAKFLRRRFFK